MENLSPYTIPLLVSLIIRPDSVGLGGLELMPLNEIESEKGAQGKEILPCDFVDGISLA